MQFAEWHRSRTPKIDDAPEDESESFGGEILDSSAEFIDGAGDVRRDELGGAWAMNCND